MIKLEVLKKKDAVRNQFIIKSDEPITIEFLETESNHTIAYVYRGTEVDEHSEPVGAYDSAVDGESWEIE